MRCRKAILAISLLLPVTACSHIHTAGVAYEPNPVPPPGYRAACTSLALPFNAFTTGCAPATAQQTAVVQVKG